MKKQNLLRIAAATLAVSAVFVACDKEEDPINPVDPTPSTVEIKVAASQTGDVLQVAYNGTLNLGTIFTLEQSEGGTATLVYTVEKQPEYVEGNSEEYTTVEAYSVSGGVLTAAQGVRVPDAVSAGDDRIRVVREGVLKVSAEGASALTYTIQMTDKPAPVPVITLAEGSEGQLAGGTLTLTTWGQPRLFSATAFDIVVDFSMEDIRVGIGSAGDNNYITISEFGGVPQAGGSAGKPGTGGFIVAYYYKDYELADVLADETLPQARLYIDVEFVDPPTPVGIEVYTERLGKCSGVSFWRNSDRKSPGDFVLTKLSDGTTRTYNSNSDGAVVAGDFDQYTEGRTSEAPMGWWSYVALKLNEALPPVGTTVKFKVTSKIHFEDPAWTVTVETQTLAESPGVACQ